MTGQIQDDRKDNLLKLVQCVLGIAMLHIPAAIDRYANIKVPGTYRLAFSLFLFCAIFLGEIMDFYYLVPHWDDFLHFGSSVMTGLFGCWVVGQLNKQTQANTIFNAGMVAVLTFGIAISVGVIWEIYEFTMDGILDLNMQKTLLENGKALCGHLAVRDTMMDLIVCMLGSFVAALIAFFMTKRGKARKKGCKESIAANR